MNSVPPRNSKELKLPPNNINININFTMKEGHAHTLPQPQLAKPLAGKKIDNYVQVNSGVRGEVRRANVTTETLKDRRRELLDEQDSSNVFVDAAELLRTKRLDAHTGKSAKQKEHSAKASHVQQDIGQSVFSTNRIKSKHYSRELREMFAKGHEPQVHPRGGGPTPAKQSSGEKTRRKSAERERIKRRSIEKPRNSEQWKLSKSVENLNRHKVLRGENRTPSRSKSKSSGSKGSSIKRRTIAVEAHTERTRRRPVTHDRKEEVDAIDAIQYEDSKPLSRRKESQKKLRGSEAQNHKFTEEELAQIRIYMAEKKKRQEKQKRLKNNEDKHRQERVRDSLGRVEIDRKANAKTIAVVPAPAKKTNSGKKKKSSKTIISMKYADKEFDELKEQAQRLIYPTYEEAKETGPKPITNANTNANTNSSKKVSSNKKEPLKSLVDKYWRENHQLAIHSQEHLNACATTIQKVIRGYLSRKHTLEELRCIKMKVREVEDNINHRRKEFWGNNSNSIIQVQQDVEHSESVIHPSRDEQNTEQEDGLPISVNESWEFQQGEGVRTPKAEDEEVMDEAEQVYRLIQRLERDPRNSKDIEYAKKLRGVVEMIRKKEEDHRRVLRQNMQLKMGIKLTKEEVNNSEQHPGTYDSIDKPIEEDPNFEFQIRMPVKISPPQTKKPEPEPSLSNQQADAVLRPSAKLPLPTKQDEISREERDQRRREIEMFKKFKEESDGMMKKTKKELLINPPAPANELSKPPSIGDPIPEVSHHFQTVRSPKNQEVNIAQLLKQKQKLLNAKQRLTSEEINDLYQRKLMSPKSYARKLSELESFEDQINAIRRAAEQFDKIVSFAKSIDKDKEEVKRLEESLKSRKQSEGGPIISKRPLGEPTMTLPTTKREQISQPDQDQDFYSSDRQNSDTHITAKSSDSDRGQSQPSFMQPLPVPINSSKIESIFRSFEEEQAELAKKEGELVQGDRSNKSSIISIFDQVADKPAQSKNNQDLQEEADELNNDMVVFVEKAKETANLPQRQRQGFDTNLNLIKEYCVGMCQLIKSTDRYRQQFKLEMTTPLRFDFFEFLASYRRTEAGDYSNSYNSFRDDLVYPFFRQGYQGQRAITQQVFEEFNDSFRVLKRNQPDATKEMIQLEEIFLKAILDVFNEALDYQRPNSILGRPMPWISKSKYFKNLALNFDSSDDEDGTEEYSKQHERLDIVFGGSIARVIQWGSALCGFIPDTVEGEDGQVIHMDEDYINHIKETRLALMLEKTLTEDEDRLHEFCDEETEVKMQTANLIATSLILELVADLRILRDKSKAIAEPNLSESKYFEYIDD